MKKTFTTIVALLMIYSTIKAQSIPLPNVTKSINTITGDALTRTAKSNARVVFYGASSVNTTADLTTSITASQKFALRLLFKDTPTDENNLFTHKPGKHINKDGKPNKHATGIDLLVGVNAINLKPPGTSKDSIDLVSLMFPETGTFGLVATPIFNWKYNADDTNTYALSAECTFAYRHVKATGVPIKNFSGGDSTATQIINFDAYNFNIMPFKISWQYKPDNDFRFEISAGLYYNVFFIPGNNSANFNLLFPKDKPVFVDGGNSHINSVGGKLNISINGFGFFADFRYNYDTNKLQDGNPFKGMVFNTGFVTSVAILSK